jgi:pyruvate-formate lyase
LGIDTGSLADFETFDEVKEAYDKQMKYWVDNFVGFCTCCDIAHQTRKPLPFLSLMIEDCIDKGIDVTAGGARYNFTGPQALSTANVADGLSAINELIFKQKKITGAEMLDALKKNWEGYEALYALVNSSKIPHYGNDIEEVDMLARFAALSYCKHIEKRPTAHGGIFQPGIYPVSGNVPAGACNGATPDGRKAGEPTSDGVSPVHTVRCSHDISGPTAVVKSVSTLDHLIASNGTLLNMRFAPSTLQGEIGDENFINMMKVFFRRKGFHNQINVVSRETLIDAQKNPEKYKGLIVRVAGYSAFFTELDPRLQQDIIDRTELEF